MEERSTQICEKVKNFSRRSARLLWMDFSRTEVSDRSGEISAGKPFLPKKEKKFRTGLGMHFSNGNDQGDRGWSGLE